MKLKIIPALSCAALLSAWTSQAALVDIAKWTFETSIPATAGPFSPEVGSGAASSVHAIGTTVYSNPVGNGSGESFSANRWTVGDYFQFKVSTIGLTAINLSWDQTSSGTGPGQFGLFYSTDGATFTQFGGNYAVLENGASPNADWGSTYVPAYSFSTDLSGVTAINNAVDVYFRLVDQTTVSANGGTVANTGGSSGTSRVDNFYVTGESPGAVVPEPSTLVAGALLTLPFGVHGVRYLRNRKRA